MYEISQGNPAALPPNVLYHVVAARYGTTPAAVRAWPVDDFFLATELLRITRGG